MSRAELQKYFSSILLELLKRMQSNKTESYTYHFVHFMCYVIAVPVDGLTPDYLIGAIEQIQPG